MSMILSDIGHTIHILSLVNVVMSLKSFFCPALSSLYTCYKRGRTRPPKQEYIGGNDFSIIIYVDCFQPFLYFRIYTRLYTCLINEGHGVCSFFPSSFSCSEIYHFDHCVCVCCLNEEGIIQLLLFLPEPPHLLPALRCPSRNMAIDLIMCNCIY